MVTVLSISFFQLFVSATTLTTCLGRGFDSFAGLAGNLKKAYPDWSPQAILDIGANKGTWSTNVRSVYPHTLILMLEASDQHVSSLEETVQSIGNAKYRIEVLSDHDGDVIPFYFNPDASTGNSMFRENTKFFAHVKPVNKIAHTLDTIVKEEGETFLRGESSTFDFIKIDVQGAELMVLSGGLKTLAKATFVQFEGSTVEYNSGGSCFYEIDEFLRANGFYYYDHADDLRHPMLFKTFGLGQWDMLYVNPNSEHLPKQLKQKQPRFCGSSPEKKEAKTNYEGSITYGINYDMAAIGAFGNEKVLIVWLFGLIVGVVIGMLIPAVSTQIFLGASQEKRVPYPAGDPDVP